MVTLLFAAVGLFYNPAAGEKQEAVQQVSSVTECAQVINDNREPKVMSDGSTWYLIDATCIVVEKK
jgi:hypothetical protein